MKKKVKAGVALIGALVIAAGVLGIGAGPVNAQQEGILFKARVGETNYCHLKFPAIRPDTLSSENPVLQNPSTGAITDFYGPCDYDPTGKAAVEAQKDDRQRMWDRDYSS
jgi:hypothetical protein